MLCAWVVDFVISVVLLFVVMGAGIGATEHSFPAGSNGPPQIGFALGLCAPALYGFCCFRGRSIGALAAGTAFVVEATGRRAGHWRMAWIVWWRAILPVGLIVLVATALTGSSGDQPDVIHTQRRVR